MSLRGILTKPLGQVLVEREEDHPLAKLDTIRLTSVGIDVGSATSQVLLSRLVMRRLGIGLSSRFVVASRDVLYLSPVCFTPYTPGRERVDDVALGRIVDDAYREAGLTAEDVDTGAIILTGEAVRRDNARAIADLFAEQRGSFVCATAGHNFEAVLAAHGSGTVAASKEQHARLLNVDIGGGTTKLTVVERGQVLTTAAFHVGGRLLARDRAGVLTVLEPGGAALARAAGFEWQAGDSVSDASMEAVAAHVARTMVDILANPALTAHQAGLFVTPQLAGAKAYDGVVFSGGVGEYVYGKETEDFGDLGAPLGRELRRLIDGGALPWPVLPARECIRATVMGASQYTVQVSGNTIYRSNASVLPRRNMQVLRPPCDLSGDIDPAAVARAIQNHFGTFDLAEGESDVALVFKWDGPPAAYRLAGFCHGLLQGVPGTIAKGHPLYLVFDGDVAGLMGHILKDELGLAAELLSIDGITLQDFDFIDLGQVLEPSGTVPVTIKSLVFQL